MGLEDVRFHFHISAREILDNEFPGLERDEFDLR